MKKNTKTYFQDIHYLRQKPNFALNFVLSIAEFFYKNVVLFKNFLYAKEILKENSVGAYVICVGNLTTGGVGKTPIVTEIANELSKTKKVAIISRGYKSKLQTKEPNVIKDYAGLKFEDGSMCGDEPFQLSKKVNQNVVIITCPDRLKASQLAIIKYGVDVIIMDDGFSNRKIKKDKTYIVIDSMMRFGNNHLLPKGPLRESVKELSRADKIIITDKGNKDINSALNWAKQFHKKVSICKMSPKRIYNLSTKADIKELNRKNKIKAIAFSAIGQPKQFYDFLVDYYEIVNTVSFADHHEYTTFDIKELIKLAKENNIHTFVTTQKDETKLINLVKDVKDYSFNVLELKNEIQEI